MRGQPEYCVTYETLKEQVKTLVEKMKTSLGASGSDFRFFPDPEKKPLKDFTILIEKIFVEEEKILSCVNKLRRNARENLGGYLFPGEYSDLYRGLKDQVPTINQAAEEIRKLFKCFQDEVSSESHIFTAHKELAGQLVLLRNRIFTLIDKAINNEAHPGSLLFLAVKKSDLPATQKLLTLNNLEPNKGTCRKTEEGLITCSPLQMAVELKDQKFVDLLLGDKRVNIFQGYVRYGYARNRLGNPLSLSRHRCLQRILPLSHGTDSRIASALLQKGAGMAPTCCNVSRAVQNGVVFSNVFTMGIKTRFRKTTPNRQHKGFEKAITNIDELQHSSDAVKSQMKNVCEQYKNSTLGKDEDMKLCNSILKSLEDFTDRYILQGESVEFRDQSVTGVSPDITSKGSSPTRFQGPM